VHFSIYIFCSYSVITFLLPVLVFFNKKHHWVWGIIPGAVIVRTVSISGLFAAAALRELATKYSSNEYKTRHTSPWYCSTSGHTDRVTINKAKPWNADKLSFLKKIFLLCRGRRESFTGFGFFWSAVNSGELVSDQLSCNECSAGIAFASSPIQSCGIDTTV